MTPDEQRLYVEQAIARIIAGELDYPQASEMVLARMGIEDLRQALVAMHRAREAAKRGN